MNIPVVRNTWVFTLASCLLAMIDSFSLGHAVTRNHKDGVAKPGIKYRIPGVYVQEGSLPKFVGGCDNDNVTSPDPTY